jgi:hypothetical protein
MVGTLMIFLPSKHEGGEMQLEHLGQTKTVETATHSEFGTSFVTWYVDSLSRSEIVRSFCGRRVTES